MYSREKRLSAIALVESGRTIPAAAKEMGVSRCILKMWYYAAHPEKKGPPHPCSHVRGPSHPESSIDAAWRLKAQGDKYEYISAFLGIPMNTMCDWFTFRTRVATNKKYAQKYGFAAKQ